MSPDVVQPSGMASAIAGFRAGGAAARATRRYGCRIGGMRIGISCSDLCESTGSLRRRADPRRGARSNALFRPLRRTRNHRAVRRRDHHGTGSPGGRRRGPRRTRVFRWRAPVRRGLGGDPVRGRRDVAGPIRRLRAGEPQACHSLLFALGRILEPACAEPTSSLSGERRRNEAGIFDRENIRDTACPAPRWMLVFSGHPPRVLTIVVGFRTQASPAMFISDCRSMMPMEPQMNIA